jgi:glycosyltransferase domain-containing protein
MPARKVALTPPASQTPPQLTVILPTHNRPGYCAAQLRFFRDCGLTHPIVVADSSDPADAQAVRDACAGVARYLRFDPSIVVSKKLARTLRTIETPFVVATPDDDVTFPHAIDAALAHLQQNPDFAAAHGYVLHFGAHGDDFDIHHVSGFTPTIAHEEPLQRLYYLIRRYQPFIWAVFRTDAFAAAMNAASGVEGLIFEELTFAATAALGGKIARLPVVFSMRGMEESTGRLDRVHPFFWFLQDSRTFFAGYAAYKSKLLLQLRRKALGTKPLRVRLALWKRALFSGLTSVRRHGRAGIPSLRRLVRNRGFAFPEGADLEQVVDMIHGIWLAEQVDFGILNHTVRRLLGDPLPPISVPPVRAEWREPAEGDEVHASPSRGRHYVWRREVLAAEPREEIAITPDEMARVERELDCYRLAEGPSQAEQADA